MRSAFVVKLGASELGAYIFRIVMSSWLTVPLVQKKYPCLLFLINFVMKSTLSYVEMGMPAYFLNLLDWNSFLPSFYSKAVLIFKVKMHFLETTERYCFLIHHSVSLCLLIGDLRLLIFKVFIEAVMLTAVVLLIFGVVVSVVLCI